MKNYYLRILIMGSRLLLYGLTLQLMFFTMVWASDSNAQKVNSIKDSEINLKVENASIREVFQEIEAQTEYRFFYDEKVINESLRFTYNVKKTSLADVLLDMSEKAMLRFKQINAVINVNEFHKSNGNEASVEVVIQGRTITGKVTASDNEGPLPGVNIVEKGTTNGTVTDIDGNYSLQVSDGATLVFSSVGYIVEEREVGNQSVMNMVLSPDIQELQELVVVGYGSRKKKDLTGAVSQIGSEEIIRGATMTPEMALQGKMAGVYVTPQGTDPNARPTIRIRGVSTLPGGNNDPLFVIDGVPVTEFGEETMNPLAMVNPNDIESISVLKDASATAIYGVRASNGVILITTKRGRKGDVRVNVRASYGIQNVKERYDVLSTPEYVDYMEEALDNNTVNTLDPKWKALYIEDPSYPSGYYLGDVTETADWQEPMLNKNAPVMDYNVNVSGGNDVSTYSVSGGFARQESPYKGNEMNRYSIAANSDHQINKWLKIGETFRYAVTDRDYPGLDNNDSRPVELKAGPAPWMPVYDPNGINGYTTHNRTLGDGTEIIGQAYGQATADHPLGHMSLIRNIGLSNRALTSVYAQVEPLEGLRFKGTLSYDWVHQEIDYMESEKIGFFKTWGAPDPNGNTYRDRSTNNRNLVKEFSILYNTNLGNHNFDVVLNAMDQSIYYDLSTVTQINFPFFDINMRGIQPSAPADDKIANAYNVRQGLQGYMGRLSYNFDSRYYLDATVRRDGSSNFAPGYKWGTFPSFAAAWRISGESFMQGMDWIDDLKIRGGWGQTGNQETKAFGYVSLININPSYSTGSTSETATDDNLNPGAYTDQFPVQDLTWETVSTTSFGFDGLFFNNQIEFTAEYYYRFTDNILQNVSLTKSTGIPNSPKVNLGQVSNKGFEFVLGVNQSIGDLNLHFNGNLTTVKNNVEKIYLNQPQVGSNGQLRIEEGFPIDYIYGYQMLGIFQTQAEVDEYINNMEDNGYLSQLAPGDIYFADLNGPPVEGGEGREQFKSFSPDNKVDAYDRTYLGKTIPGYFYGFSIAADYKQLFFNVAFRGMGDVEKINYDRSRHEDMEANGRNMFTSIKNRWTPENPSNSMPRAIYRDPSGNNRFSSRWVESGAFIRMDNIQLGYNLPSGLMERLKLNNASVALSATNLFDITPYTGLDPETIIPTTVKLDLNLSF